MVVRVAQFTQSSLASTAPTLPTTPFARRISTRFFSQSHKQYSSLLHLLAQGSIPNLSFRRFTLQRRYLTTKRAARLPKHLPSAPKQTPPVTRTIPLARAPTHRGGPRICRLIPHLHPLKMLSPSSSPTALSLHQQTHLSCIHTFQNDPHPTNTYPLSSSSHPTCAFPPTAISYRLQQANRNAP